MKIIQQFFFMTLLLVFSIQNYAQKLTTEKVSYIGTVTSMEHVPSIASQYATLPAYTDKVEMQDGRASGNIVVPGKDPQKLDDYFVRNKNPYAQSIKGKEASLVFDAYSSGSSPTDPSLAVGPNHVFVVFNTGFIIYDKEGNALTPQTAPNPTIFPSGGCCDLTVSYDQAADRWVVTFLGSGAQIAVSDGPDPINDGWYTYTISQINDYQKLSVWSDGYYITENTNSSNKVWALERDAMIAGDPNAKILGFNLPGITTSGFYSPQAFNVSDEMMPAAGNAPIVYLQDDAWGGVSQDHVKMWLVNVDWANTGNSTISTPQEIITTPFISVFDNGSFSNLTQPGGGVAIDALQATIMNQAQFRKFADHNSAIFNFVVDTDATGGELAGVRWFELRQDADGEPWSLYQEGTYTAPEGRHAWHASMMMDMFGNIGMGYSSMSGPTTTETVRVSSYYTGRYSYDAPNTMTVAEELIANGNANIPGLRYGDYSKIDIDPEDDKTFWFINEYMNSGRKGVVGRFKLAPDYFNDLGVITLDAPTTGILSDQEEMTISIFNYGEDTQSNFPVSYQIDGGTAVVENYSGSLASGETGQYTFSTLADLSNEGHVYTILLKTDLTGDEDTSNDTFSTEITHMAGNDVGVTEIIAPTTGNNLEMEEVSVKIQNFGLNPQENFDVSFRINDEPIVIENVSGPLNGEESMIYTFTTLGDFSEIQGYQFSCETNLENDVNQTNDKTNVTIYNSTCFGKGVSSSIPIGPDEGYVANVPLNITHDYLVNDVNVTITVEHPNVSDLDIYLIAPDGTRVELSTDNGGEGDNYTDTVFDDDASIDITDGEAPFTGSYVPEGDLNILNGMSSTGTWNVEFTDDSDLYGGFITYIRLDICGTTSLGIYDNIVDSDDFIIKTLDNDHFEIILSGDQYDGIQTLNIYDTLGRQIVYHKLSKKDGNYYYPLDMSYMPSGVYLVRLGNDKAAHVKRIIVK